MIDPAPARPAELSGRPAIAAVVIVALALVGGTWWGWSYAGPVGGLLGMLAGVAIGALAFTVARLFSTADRFSERAAPDVRGLPPDQAIQVLSAMMRAGSESGPGSGGSVGLDIGGGLLTQIRKARAEAEAGELEAALSRLRGLAQEHPRSPAVPAAIAELCRGDPERSPERHRASTRAIHLAIRGGMNRVAAQVFLELEDAEHGELELTGQEWSQLERIFSAQGDEARAALCRERD